MHKPKVLVTDNTDKTAESLLRGVADVDYIASVSAEELLNMIDQYDGLIVRSASTITAEVLEKAKNLKIIGRAGVGTDNIDLAAATQRGVIVVNSPEGNTVAAAEHTVAMLFAMARNVAEGDRTMKEGEWARKKLMGVELFGKTLGVIGMGKIGARVVRICQRVGMKVMAYDPFLSDAKVEEMQVKRAETLDDIWENADFITVHVPKNKDTVNLLNKTTLGKCKPGVRIVNCARGGVINEAELAEMIASGHVGGAALDVYESEPPAADSPLLKLGTKVTLTPHLGASTEEAQVNVAIDVAEQIRDFFQEGVARSAVNIPLLREDILGPVKPWMTMAETLGRLVRQAAEGPTNEVELIARGEPLANLNIQPLTLAVLKGILALSRESVNYVNAPLIAEERGVVVKRSAERSAGSFTNLLTVRLTSKAGVHTVSGTLISEDQYRIVEINGYPLTLEASPSILFTPHINQPGMVAKVATVLGAANININAMEVARTGAGTNGSGPKESLMAFNLDESVSDEILSQLQGIDGITDAWCAKL